MTDDIVKDDLINDLYRALDNETRYSDFLEIDDSITKETVNLLDRCERLGYGKSKTLTVIAARKNEARMGNAKD